MGGLTMSLEGGFDDVVEFFRAVASSRSSSSIRCVCCSMRFSNAAFRASKRRMTAKSSRRDGASLRFLMKYPSESTRKTCHSAFGAVNGYTKRAYGLDRCTGRGWDGFQRYVGSAIVAWNRQVLARHLLA